MGEIAFSMATRNELAQVEVKSRCCQKAEMAGLLASAGKLARGQGEMNEARISTASAAVVRRALKLSKEIWGAAVKAELRHRKYLRGHPIYTLALTWPNLSKDGEVLGIRPFAPTRQCCRRAFIRGAFLGGGSVNRPSGGYHLEIAVRRHDWLFILASAMSHFKLMPQVRKRRHKWVVYLKEADEVAQALNVMQAHQALLELENHRAMRTLRGQVNRVVNCETGNLGKTAEAAAVQLENIHFLDQVLGLEHLPPPLEALARLRLEYPDANLKELGKMLDPPLGKSGVNHRMRKINRWAEEAKRGNIPAWRGPVAPGKGRCRVD